MRSGITRRWLRGSLLITVLLVLLAETMFLYNYTRGYYNSVQQRRTSSSPRAMPAAVRSTCPSGTTMPRTKYRPEATVKPRMAATTIRVLTVPRSTRQKRPEPCHNGVTAC